MERVYLDYAATTPVRHEVFEAMKPYLNEAFGNPSTLYSYGEEARDAMEEARRDVAALVNSTSGDIVFTSGGTEANNLAIKGAALALQGTGNHVITSAVEHHSVLGPCHSLERQGFEITYLPVDCYGRVDPDDVKKAIKGKTVLITIMHANNEVGTIQPLAHIAKIARENNVYFHTDAIQSQGHIHVNVEELDVDLLSMSAHKIYGPKGIGALYVRKDVKVTPLLDGGEQEGSYRAGTENMPGIVGFGTAARLIKNETGADAARLSKLRDYLIARLHDSIPDIYLNGHPSDRLPGNVNISIDFVEGDSVCLDLDLEGICAATGSACTTSSIEPSHVLLAMGRNKELAHGSLRLSMGKWTKKDELDRVAEALPGIVYRLREISPLYK